MKRGLGPDSGPTGIARAFGIALVVSLVWAHRAGLRPDPAHRIGGGALDAALYDPLATSPLLGLAVLLGLLWLRRGEIALAWGRAPAHRLALGFGIPGLALLAWSHAVSAPGLLLPALALELAGLAAWFGGATLLRAVASPLLALVFVTPLPPVLLNQLVLPMQLATVWLTSTLLDWIGMPHLVAGDLILTEGGRFQVIEGCSGLKTMLSLLLAALVYAEIAGPRGLARTVLVALAPLAAFLANGVRVVVLVHRKVPAESAEHQAYGIAAVGLGVVLLAAVEVGLSRTVFRNRGSRDPFDAEPSRAGTRVAADGLARLPIASRVAIALFGSGLVCLSQASVPAGFALAKDPRPLNIESLPPDWAGRTARAIRPDSAWLGNVRFGHSIYRAYERVGEAPIRVFVGLPDPSSRDVSALSPKTSIPRSGWISLERGRSVRAGAIERESLALRYDPRLTGDALLDRGTGADHDPHSEDPVARAGMVLVEHVRIGFAPWEEELLRSWLRLDHLTSPQSGLPLVLRFEIDADGDPEAARLSLRQFADGLLEWAAGAGWIPENTQ